VSISPEFAGILMEHDMSALVFLKLPEVCRRRAQGVTAVYAAVKTHLLTPPVKLTRRSSAWPEHEVDTINVAITAGRSENEIRELVSRLVAARQQPTA
jgi:prophage regulatory protein